MKFLNKLERKYGRYAIHGFMRYIVVINIVGAMIGVMVPDFYYMYLNLDMGLVLKGQIWRLFTYILAPGITRTQLMNPMNMLFFALELYLYYFIGNSLENQWGAFRFNLYYISGYLLNIVASVILYAAFHVGYPIGLSYINQSLFLAFAALYPNIQLMLFFIIPIKVKWLGIFYGGILAYNILICFMGGQLAMGAAILVSMANFLIFFSYTRNYAKISPKQMKRRAEYRNNVKKAVSITRHKCAICGRTELDDENLEFRFCSKCEGNYEYCMEHLYTHEHVKKVVDFRTRD